MPRPKILRQRLRISFYVEAEQKRRLDRLAAAKGVPWAELAREGLDMVLARYKSEAKRRR